jgi:CHASE3 domain sensor protein
MDEIMVPTELNAESVEPESLKEESAITISQITQEVQGLSFWLQLFSILGYIMVGIIVIFSIGMMIMGITGASMADSSMGLSLIPLLALMAGVVWFYLTLMNLLSQGSKSLREAEIHQSTQSIKDFLYCIRRYFKITGIATLIYVGLMVIYFLVLMAAGMLNV